MVTTGDTIHPGSPFSSDVWCQVQRHSLVGLNSYSTNAWYSLWELNHCHIDITKALYVKLEQLLMLRAKDFEMFSLKGLYGLRKLTNPLKPPTGWTTKCIKDVLCYSRKVWFFILKLLTQHRHSKCWLIQLMSVSLNCIDEKHDLFLFSLSLLFSYPDIVVLKNNEWTPSNDAVYTFYELMWPCGPPSVSQYTSKCLQTNIWS